MGSRLFRLAVFCMIAGFSYSFAFAEILYRVKPSPAGDKRTVGMEFDVSAPVVEFQMPSWSPGVYMLQNSWETMRQVAATDESGRSLQVTRTRNDTRSITSSGHKRIIVSCDRPIPGSRFDSNQTASDAGTVHCGAQPIYLYVVGRKEESAFWNW